MGKGYKPMLIFIHAGNAHNRDNFLLTLAKKPLRNFIIVLLLLLIYN